MKSITSKPWNIIFGKPEREPGQPVLRLQKGDQDCGDQAESQQKLSLDDSPFLSPASSRMVSPEGTGNHRSNRSGPPAPGEHLEPARSLCPIPQPGSPAWHQNRPEATSQSTFQSCSKSCVPGSRAERAALRAVWKFTVDAQRSRVRMGIGTPPMSLGGRRGISRKGFLQPALSSDLSLRHHSAERTGHSSKPMGSPCGTSSPHSRHLAISGDLFCGHSW